MRFVHGLQLIPMSPDCGHSWSTALLLNTPKDLGCLRSKTNTGHHSHLHHLKVFYKINDNMGMEATE